jgi:putative DNA primase/helicase
MAPEIQFAECLRANGRVVEDNHQVMDGSKQRIKIEGE